MTKLANRELVSESCQSNRLVFGPSQLIHDINRLGPWPSRLMSGLPVSFSESVSGFELDSGFLYSEVVIVRIAEVRLELEEFYDL